MREALLAGDWNDVVRLLALEWENRKRNFTGISTPTGVLEPLKGGRGRLCLPACPERGLFSAMTETRF